MYKLVVVGGKLRGKEFVLEDGENIIGRDTECDVVLGVDGVSKRHLSITVTNDVAYVQDLNSSNGTFVNGKLVSRATVKNGDQLGLPDLIIQIIHVKEKKKIVKKRMGDSQGQDDPYGEYVQPQNFIEKIVHFFKFKVMKILYGINEEYEWRVLFGIILTVFILVTVTLVVYPVLKDSESVLVVETAKRGNVYAEIISRQNARALEQRNLDSVDTSFLDSESDVVYYELFDFEGRIVRPLDRRNQYINNPFSVQVREWAIENTGSSDSYATLLSGGEIGIGRRITAYNPRTGTRDPVGMLAMRFAPESLIAEAVKGQKVYLEAIVTGVLVAIIFFGMVYFLTTRPIVEMQFQIDEALRGRRKELDSKYLFLELEPLRNIINSLLQKNRELQNDTSDEFVELESDDEYVRRLEEFLKASGVPAMVLDSEKKIKKLNVHSEDLTGIRESSSLDMDLLDACREQGFAATLIELCDQCANNNGDLQKGQYELGGIDYEVNVNALLGRDSFAKAFFITFLKD